ncbi:MAG TPA: class I SAM-dependent methyltransferase [Chthonomonadaceae bacterium]|nr:class I SAM-dependent methyltransferase [Chthonomonadaceae bacterium]
MESPPQSLLGATPLSEPPFVLCRRFLTSGAQGGQRTLDVGCGQGDLCIELAALGCDVVGVEIDEALVAGCRARGIEAVRGAAEQLPFPDASFDRIVCSVVVPYTDERKAIAEWARLLRPGGTVYATYHGLGYGLDYLLRGDRLKTRVYGARMLANTLCYGLSGRRLPGFLGDTLCQTRGRLRRFYRRHGLTLERETVASAFLGQPQFLCHRLGKA